MNKLLIAIATTLSALSLSLDAGAHGEAKPLHGGIVQVADDVHYELVPQGADVSLYVVDHGKPADATGMSGKLTVLQGTSKSQGDLKPAGGNRLLARGVTVAAGAKVVASVKGADGKATTVRFVVK